MSRRHIVLIETAGFGGLEKGNLVRFTKSGLSQPSAAVIVDVTQEKTPH